MGQWWFCSSLQCRRANIWWFTLNTLPPWLVDWQGQLLLVTQTQSQTKCKVRYVCWACSADHDCTECHLVVLKGCIVLKQHSAASNENIYFAQDILLAVKCLKKALVWAVLLLLPGAGKANMLTHQVAMLTQRQLPLRGAAKDIMPVCLFPLQSLHGYTSHQCKGGRLSAYMCACRGDCAIRDGI